MDVKKTDSMAEIDKEVILLGNALLLGQHDHRFLCLQIQRRVGSKG